MEDDVLVAGARGEASGIPGLAWERLGGYGGRRLLRGGGRGEGDQLRRAGELSGATGEANCEHRRDGACAGRAQRGLAVEDTVDAARELRLAKSTEGAERERQGGAVGRTIPQAALRQRGEAGGVDAGREGDAKDTVVAGEFALAAEAALDPDKRRVEREEGEADLLQKIEPVVGAAQVLDLVEDDLEELGRGELACRE
jgi:hypothetical protein